MPQEPRTERDWPELRRQRRAIVVVDLVESVRRMRAAEIETIELWRHFVADVRSELLAAHGARMVKSLGDGMLLECEHTPRAVALAFALQSRMAAVNQSTPGDRPLQLRIGVHTGDIVIDELDVYGSDVNLAARLTGLAHPGGVAASVESVDELLPGIDAQLTDGGRCYLKGLDAPVQVYHLTPPAPGRPARAEPLPAPEGSALDDARLKTGIALVPIDHAAGDPEQHTLADLLGDALLTRLSAMPLMRVVSRLSTEQFRLRGLTPQQIAQQSHAAYLLAGRLHHMHGATRAFLELVDTDSEAIVWSESMRLRGEELLDDGESVTQALAQAIVDSISVHQLRRVGVSPLPTLASQTLQYAAIHLMHRQSAGDFARAYEMLQHLAERHPKAAAPHAWLAKWHVLRITKGWSFAVHDEGERAIGHTTRALDLAPDSAMTLAMEALAVCHMRGDLAVARSRIDEALALNPNEPWAWLVGSTIESLLGHGDAAWQSALRARALSPMDPLKHYYDGLAASAAVSAGRWADAAQLAELALSKDPRHLPTLRALSITQVHQGQLDAARGTAAKVLRLQPDFTLARYVSDSPRGGEAMRRRWAEALREAGLPP